jgi:3D (Asp-Asp-Asp) domain-containing protein
MTRIERRRARRAARIYWASFALLCICIAALCTAIAVSALAIEPDAEPELLHETKSEVVAAEPVIQEDFENEKIEAALLEKANRIENVTVTHYAVCVECCGNGLGITASGRNAVPYFSVAVDPGVIPLGAEVLVDYGDGEIFYYQADDTGRAVKGNHIDVCVSSYDEAVELGVKSATVYWLEE